MYNQMKEKKYLSLYVKIKNQILSGEFKAGEKLPSKRVLADINGVSVITVETALGMLSDEGYITPQQRSGYYVCSTVAYAPQRWDLPFNLKPLPEESQVESADDFEYSVWFKTVRKVISEKERLLFVKSPGKGISVLRNEISKYLLRYRGMMAQPEQILIGSGSEQLYEIIVKILGRDKIFGIENPSYPQIEAVYKATGAGIEKLTMDKDGIESDALSKSRADVLHVTPFQSYPSGITTSALKKYEYLKWAKNAKYIVEDDFNSEFFIPGKPIETLYSLDNNEKIIYINTFSKSLSPSMRMGYMILPPHLMKEYDKKMGMFSCSVPVLDQYVLTEFIKSGSFERHLNRKRRKMRRMSTEG